MTAPASTDDDLARARELAAAHRGIPSIRALKVALGSGDGRAKAARDALLADQAQRHADRRAAMRRVVAKRSSGRPGRSARAAVLAHLAALLPSPPAVPAAAEIIEVTAPTGPAEDGPDQAAQSAPERAEDGPADAVAGHEEPVVEGQLESTRDAAGQGAPEPGRKRVATWPAFVVATPAWVAIWAGWVAIGKLTGFGRVDLLPGIGGGWVVDTAITLPVGVEAYSAYAFYVALNVAAPRRARRFGAVSAAIAVVLGMGGQTAYHLMSAAQMTAAPWQITTFVSCLPVGVFALVAVLVHMVRTGEREEVQ